MRITLLFLLSVILFNGCQFIINETLKKEIPEKTAEIKPIGNKIENGVYRKFRDDGKLFTEILMKNGKRHGLARDFYPNGSVHHEIEYVEGMKHGSARTYYESGILYMESGYKNGLLNGERKIYRQNSTLSSMVPFKDDFPGKGLLEYLEDGSLKTKYPKLIIKPVDRIAAHNTFILEVNFSLKYKKKPEFYVGDLVNEVFIHDQMHRVRVTDDHAGIIEIDVPPESFLKKELNIVGVFYTTLGNPFVVESKYLVNVEN